MRIFVTFNKVESSAFIERRKSVPGGCWKVPPHKSLSSDSAVCFVDPYALGSDLSTG